MSQCIDLDIHVDLIRHETDPRHIYAMLIHGLPRRYHLSASVQRRHLLSKQPDLTGTAWNALLAAVMEHATWPHGEPKPAWIEEAERFLDKPWLIAGVPEIARDCVRFTPAAFIRHGVLVDPRGFCPRHGDFHAWYTSR